MSTKKERAIAAAQMRRWRKTPAGKASVKRRNASGRQKEARKRWEKRHLNYRVNTLLKIKRVVVDFFGGKCLDCGIQDLDVLTIDHVDGGGRIHREKVLGQKHMGGMFRWVWRFVRDGKEIPIKVELVCRNCNWKRHLVKLRKDKENEDR